MSSSNSPGTKRAGTPGVVRIESADRRLQQKLGAPASSMLTPEVVARASEATTRLAVAAMSEIEKSLAAIETLARERPGDAAERIFLLAHDLRGVAGTFGRERLGRIATSLCAYLEPRRGGGALDANTLTMLIIAARQTITGDADPLADELVEECEALVEHANGGVAAR